MSVDLAVIRIDTKDDNRIRIEIGNRTKKISGAAKVVQEIVRLILTTPGTDERRPGQGAGFQNILRRVSSRGNIDAARVDIITRFADLAQQIQDNQVGADIEPDETLDRLEILEVRFDRRWIIRVRVRTLGTALVADFGNILLPEGASLFGG